MKLYNLGELKRAVTGQTNIVSVISPLKMTEEFVESARVK